jgi:hypothetical protein
MGYGSGDEKGTAYISDGKSLISHIVNSARSDDLSFPYGGSPSIPVTGDWGNQGHTGIGVVVISTGTWYLRRTPSAGAADITPFQ